MQVTYHDGDIIEHSITEIEKGIQLMLKSLR